MFNTPKDCLDFFRAKEISYVNFIFVDILGQARVATRPTSAVTESTLNDGLLLHGAGVVKPDISTAFNDTYSAYPTVSMLCDVLDSAELDSRSIIKKATALLTKHDIAANAR